MVQAQIQVASGMTLPELGLTQDKIGVQVMKFKFKNKNRHRVIRKENTNFIDFVLVATTDSPRLLFLNFISYKHIILLSITIWHFLTCTEYHDVFESALLLGLSNLCSNQGARNGTCFAYLTREKH